ncbi:GerW family sporulation protein [Clostridium beijerinckii]|uniref:GerW family sporulation protein n=1 Tax=Clostridium beijerinckii TaxID=1520 RepID=UPI00098C5F1A|nr:spore germination protein GerW family protein [Clostridium beijerinckii]MBA8933164.1 putative spore protein YtfJ [Clostridium beijerinckii]NRT36889.1 putative spore protein YtfJ [Clostridium beijerinckii]NRT43677.1 putative spore protein YtfJ [Clostridium beijerinckii]NRU37365.1 putative spore protein YtfJ [Clostridium beijerinckii]NRZ22330.1 putative spore protein YtfJ [Clostridium beijerinckii]
MDNGAKNEDIDTLFIKSGKHFMTEIVIGEPIILEEVILIPVIRFMVSYGISGEKCDSSKGMKGVDIGECIGVSVSLDAILIIRDGKTTIMQIRRINNLDDILSCIPDRVGKFNINKENIKEEINFSL